MLTEKRYELILELLDKKRSVTVPEIKECWEFGIDDPAGSECA